jgi:ATP-binding cassette subfamily F protein 3
MVSINNISLAFNGIPLLSSISFTVNPKDKIGLTGKNGAGKSTLLKIISGIQEYDTGTVSMPKDTRIGYLPQQMKYPEGKTVMEETLNVFSEIIRIREEIDRLNRHLTEIDDFTSKVYLSVVHKIAEAEEKFIHSGGNTFRAEE